MKSVVAFNRRRVVFLFFLFLYSVSYYLSSLHVFMRTSVWTVGPKAVEAGGKGAYVVVVPLSLSLLSHVGQWNLRVGFQGKAAIQTKVCENSGLLMSQNIVSCHPRATCDSHMTHSIKDDTTFHIRPVWRPSLDDVTHRWVVVPFLHTINEMVVSLITLLF